MYLGINGLCGSGYCSGYLEVSHSVVVASDFACCQGQHRREGSDEVCECKVFRILQDLFQEEAVGRSVICGSRLNKDGSCHQSFMETVFYVLCEIQKST